MRLSTLFSQTLREVPADAATPGHQLLLRAGFIRPLAAGIFSELPLARRSLVKIASIMREEINAIGGQEIRMPVIHPSELWKETGRWYQIGSEMGRFKDRGGRDMALAMTHEEVIADLVRGEVRSYRQLPCLLYHIQTKWRDDPRPRAGLIRTREFTMLDSYSLDRDEAGLEKQYRAHYQAYFNIFHRCGLEVEAVESDVGMMGGQMAHEFMALNPHGEDAILFCDHCDYTANRQIARFQKHPPHPETPKELERVATPGASTIADLAALLEIPTQKTAKAIFMMAKSIEGAQETESLVLAILRGDMELNETKLANAIKAAALRPAEAHEIRSAGAVPGFASPIGLKDVRIVVDDLIPESPNLVGGANQVDAHFLNVNYGRDFHADLVTDIALATEGDPCPQCQQAMRTERGIEVGNIFKLGTRYSQAMGATYLDEEGQAQPILMGSYGIGLGRLLASIAEEHFDENGLVWPISVAPFQIHLLDLRGGQETAHGLYETFLEKGFEVLYDDRDERPGVKFNDADLIGIPLRLTVSKRSLKNGGVEFKARDQDEVMIIPLEKVLPEARSQILDRERALNARVVKMPYKS